jgi:hypothetical protein
MNYIAGGLFLLSLVWLAYVIVVLRPRAQAWHNYQVMRKYRRSR